MIRELHCSIGDPGVFVNVLAYIDDSSGDGAMMVSGRRFYIVDHEFIDSAVQNAANGGDPGAEDERDAAEAQFDRLRDLFKAQAAESCKE